MFINSLIITNAATKMYIKKRHNVFLKIILIFEANIESRPII